MARAPTLRQAGPATIIKTLSDTKSSASIRVESREQTAQPPHTLSTRLSTTLFSPALSKRKVSLGIAVPGGRRRSTRRRWFETAVIPGRRVAASPESIITDREYGFRVRRFAPSRNDDQNASSGISMMLPAPVWMRARCAAVSGSMRSMKKRAVTSLAP